MRGLQTRVKLCSTGGHWLGQISCYCSPCDALQSGWEVCEDCGTIQGQHHLCACGLTTELSALTEGSPKRSPAPFLAEKAVRKSNGHPIDADADEEIWLELRQSSIGASDAMKLIKQNGERRIGFYDLLAHKKMGSPDQEFWAFAHGEEREPLIARWIQINLPGHELCHNRFVYAGEDFRHLATPDMVGPRSLAEIKTSSKPLAQARSRYFDQLQWQMHVTGYESVLFVVENRYSLEIEYELVLRDQDRIDLLIAAANDLLDAL